MRFSRRLPAFPFPVLLSLMRAVGQLEQIESVLPEMPVSPKDIYEKKKTPKRVKHGKKSLRKLGFQNNGLEGLKPKKNPGNPMAKYYTKKHFDTKEEQLEYENMKLRIENELLKKGYLMKGDGTLVAFKNKNK